MGMSTHIQGFRVPDETWHRMAAAYDACMSVHIEPPKAVLDYFHWTKPDPAGVQVELKQGEHYEEYNDGRGCSGIQIKLDKLPPGLTHIRFKNCW